MRTRWIGTATLSCLLAAISLLSGVVSQSSPVEADHGRRSPDIGAVVDQPIEFTDAWYLPRTLLDLGEDRKAYVLFFVTATCPLAQRYLPIVQEIEKDYREQGVAFVALNVGPEDSIADAAEPGVILETQFPIVKDFDARCAKLLGVRRTCEAVVLDANRKIRYRGRVDDQYRFAGNRPEPSRRDLKEALDDVLAGREVRVAETPVDGCLIRFPDPPSQEPPPAYTFAEDVRPILQQNCVRCHFEGSEAPFALETYDDAADRAPMIAEVVRQRRMPPWFAPRHFGPFTNAPSMTDQQRQVVIDWATGKRLRGSEQVDADRNTPTTRPDAPTSRSGWMMGQPDRILELPKTYTIKPTGYLPYQYGFFLFVATHDMWIKSAEIRPDNPRVVHHANLFFIEPGDSGPRNAGLITGRVPGGGPLVLEDGVAMMIPRGSILGIQIHFITTGVEEKCNIRVGFQYPRETIHKRWRYLLMNNETFCIPPGAARYRVTATGTLDGNASGIGLFCHMHLRGTDMTFNAIYPDERRETLLIVPNYSFDWQLAYRWPPNARRFPKGTKIECIGHFDNSAFNPLNPDPTVAVPVGDQSDQEMMYGFLFYTDEDEHLNVNVDPKTGREMKASGG